MITHAKPDPVVDIPTKGKIDTGNGLRRNALNQSAILALPADELKNRLQVLLGSHAAGNKRNPQLKNEISYIIDRLLTGGTIDKGQHRLIYERFVR